MNEQERMYAQLDYNTSRSDCKYNDSKFRAYLAWNTLWPVRGDSTSGSEEFLRCMNCYVDSNTNPLNCVSPPPLTVWVVTLGVSQNRRQNEESTFWQPCDLVCFISAGYILYSMWSYKTRNDIKWFVDIICSSSPICDGYSIGVLGSITFQLSSD